MPHLLSDFTLVSPWAARHERAAARGAGCAAGAAEAAKTTEYGCSGGTSVRGMAMEAGGRHGLALAAHLVLLASFALARAAAPWAGAELPGLMAPDPPRACMFSCPGLRPNCALSLRILMFNVLRIPL